MYSSYVTLLLLLLLLLLHCGTRTQHAPKDATFDSHTKKTCWHTVVRSIQRRGKDQK